MCLPGSCEWDLIWKKSHYGDSRSPWIVWMGPEASDFMERSGDRQKSRRGEKCKDEKVTVTLLEAKGTLGLRKLERQDILPLRSRRDGPADS